MWQKIWKYINGKKTSAGMVIVLLANFIKLFLPNLLPLEQIEFIETIGIILGGGGLLHKGKKFLTIKKISK